LRDGNGLILVLAGVAGAQIAIVVVATSCASTVDLDTVALAGDAVSLTGTGAAFGARCAVAGER